MSANIPPVPANETWHLVGLSVPVTFVVLAGLFIVFCCIIPIDRD